jgi:hypothetical protein
LGDVDVTNGLDIVLSYAVSNGAVTSFAIKDNGSGWFGIGFANNAFAAGGVRMEDSSKGCI